MSKSKTTTSLTPSTGLQLWRTLADISYVGKAQENIANNTKISVEEIIEAT